MKQVASRFVIEIGIVWLVISAFGAPAFSQIDKEGCTDHPLLTRMQDFYIKSCDKRDYNAVEFKETMRDGGNRTIKVEGKYYFVEYKLKSGKVPPSKVQIFRNYQNPVKRIGGVVSAEGISWTHLKLTKGSAVYWIIVDAIRHFPDGTGYDLIVVEKAELAQEVVVDAKAMMQDIQTKGSASVYGIYFDFGKADIKPESEIAIREIARLLQANRALKLYVVGHTDNIGDLDYNLRLSKARADVVVRELVTKYGISPDRLKAYGVGSLAPIASNKTEEGRAMNRRVELVEQ
jgi:outer membrane protein OmpA-like peptidoglycan-associated protein